MDDVLPSGATHMKLTADDLAGVISWNREFWPILTDKVLAVALLNFIENHTADDAEISIHDLTRCAVEAIPQQPAAEGTCRWRCSEASECDGSCAPVAVTAEPAVEATGTINGYLLTSRAVPIILDGSIPRWMIGDKVRVTISPTGGKSDA